MPIKQVTCSVCGATVNKAQTYFVGNGRACKVHEGVQEQRDERHAAKTLETLKARRALEQRYGAWTRKPAPITEADLGPSCFVCRAKGLHQQEFFFRCLVAMKKLELAHGGPVNPFTLKGPLVTERCIFVVPKEKVPPQLLQKIHPHARFAVDIAGLVALCGPCGHGVELLPPIEWEQLKAAGVLMAFVEPTLKEIATRETTRDN